MVLKEALERHVASLLRPWLRQEPALQFELGIFRCNGYVKRLDLDVSALNSALMQSSPLIMQLARVESLNAVVLPWRNPVLTLEIRGLHIVMSPRDQFNSLLTTEKALLANLSFTTSAITIMSYVDELATVIQVLGDYQNAVSNTSHRFVTRGRDACPSQELQMVLNVLHSNHENAGSYSEGFTSQVFGVTFRPLSTSFAVAFTFELASLDLIFEGSRRNLVGGSSRDARKDNLKKEKRIIDND